MSATIKPNTNCYQCKFADGVYIMSDKKLTKGKFKSFCRDCYFQMFDKGKK